MYKKDCFFFFNKWYNIFIFWLIGCLFFWSTFLNILFLIYYVCSNDERDHMLVTSNPPVAALRTHVPSGVSPLSGEDAWLEANFTDSLSGINDYYHKWDAIKSYNTFISYPKQDMINTHTHILILCRYDIPSLHNHYSPQTPNHNKAQLRGCWTAPLALHDDLTPSICSSVCSLDKVK